MIRQIIKDLVSKICLDFLAKNQKLELKVEKPPRPEFGDYALELYFIAKGKKERFSSDKCLKIVKQIRNSPKFSQYFNRVEFKEPVFFNFFLNETWLKGQLNEVLTKKDKFGGIKIGKNKKVQVEFISANPTGPLTIGNTRGGPFGDTLANVLSKSGFKVIRAYYVNDYGMQILALGHSVLKDKEAKYKGEYINELSKKVKAKDPFKVGQKAAGIILSMIKKTVKRLGIKYDQWFFESELHKSGKVDRVLKILKKKGLVYQKEGATWFKSSKLKDERDRVLIKKDGFKTYLAGDIAYHYYKFKKQGFDKVINVWGADHFGDVPGLIAGVEAIGYKGKLEVILHQFITLLEGGEKKKMSKRQGVYVTMDELIDQVGSDVIRFFFLQKSINTHLNFDLALAKEQSEKNPVYYIQYAHARISSIIRNAKKIKIKKPDYQKLNHPSEINLIKQIIRFPEIVEDTSKDYQVQRIAQYALDLATVFHQFYRDCRVISDDQELTQARLSLVIATRTVLKNTLDLMGVSSPEKM